MSFLASYRSSGCRFPIFQAQPGHATELACVMCHKDEVMREADPQERHTGIRKASLALALSAV